MAVSILIICGLESQHIKKYVDFAAHNVLSPDPHYTVPKVIDFPRYNMKCSEENVILRGIFHVVSGFPLHAF